MTCSRCRCDRAHFRALRRVAARETVHALMGAGRALCFALPLDVRVVGC